MGRKAQLLINEEESLAGSVQKYQSFILFHSNLGTTNSRFCLVNIFLRKFDTSLKKEIKMTKTLIL